MDDRATAVIGLCQTAESLQIATLTTALVVRPVVVIMALFTVEAAPSAGGPVQVLAIICRSATCLPTVSIRGAPLAENEESCSATSLAVFGVRAVNGQTTTEGVLGKGHGPSETITAAAKVCPLAGRAVVRMRVLSLIPTEKNGLSRCLEGLRLDCGLSLQNGP